MFCYILITVFASTWANDSETDIVRRVTGGDFADIKNYPYAVALLYNNHSWAGGSILSRNIVISTAHTFTGRKVSGFTVVAGSTLLNESERGLSVRKVISHEKYNYTNDDYDVAIVFLKGLLEFNENIQPIALTNSPTPEEAKITLVGWGRLYFNGPISQILRKVEINVISRENCHNIFKDYRCVTDRMFCAIKEEKGGMGSCNGDSGGPAVYNNKLVGIISWSFKCGKRPTVFASVSKLFDWIVKTANENGENNLL